jgi:hypothetical protein
MMTNELLTREDLQQFRMQLLGDIETLLEKIVPQDREITPMDDAYAMSSTVFFTLLFWIIFFR